MGSDAHDSDRAAPTSGAPATPRVSGEVSLSAESPPESSTRQAQAGAAEHERLSEPSDTLLSAGKPADRLELMLEDRMAQVDERLRELDARVSILEKKKPTIAPEARQKPWLWIAFLIALVIVFQLLHRVR